MPRHKDATGTRQQILRAACPAFGSKGFRATTIADICRLAGTNLASVNYHFGGKDALYVEAWREAFRQSIERHPPDGGVPADAPPEERLRGWVVALLRRIKDPACHDFAILHMEMANSTGLLFAAIHDSIAPMEQILAGILRELLGPKASEEDLLLCGMSVRSQCLNPMVIGKHPAGPAGGPPPPRPPVLEMEAEAIADHVIRFCLGGLPGVRSGIETRKPARGKRRL